MIARLSGDNRIGFAYILFRVFAEALANRLRLTNEELVRAKEEIRRLQTVAARAAAEDDSPGAGEDDMVML